MFLKRFHISSRLALFLLLVKDFMVETPPFFFFFCFFSLFFFSFRLDTTLVAPAHVAGRVPARAPRKLRLLDMINAIEVQKHMLAKTKKKKELKSTKKHKGRGKWMKK